MVSPIIKVLDELLQGTPLQSHRLKLAALLKDVAKEAEEDSEIIDVVQEICTNLVVALDSYGKDVDPNECVEKLTEAVMKERSSFLFNLARSIRARRRRKRGSGMESI